MHVQSTIRFEILDSTKEIIQGRSKQIKVVIIGTIFPMNLSLIVCKNFRPHFLAYMRIECTKCLIILNNDILVDVLYALYMIVMLQTMKNRIRQHSRDSGSSLPGVQILKYTQWLPKNRLYPH